jgi:hypothetical protein
MYRTQPHTSGVLRTGLCIGMAGGLAEIAVVWLYSTLSGGSAAMVARQVASSVGLNGAAAGIAVHMSLAVALGMGLAALMRTAPRRPMHDAVVYTFMLGGLAAVWAVNFFVVLPAISPSFVHLLPLAVTLASKLAFGLAAAVTACALTSAGSEPAIAGAPRLA